MAPKRGDVKSSEHDGASPGKIFIGGLAKDTSNAAFTKHFGKYGDIIDSVIMKDRHSGQPRGFGFVTYADPSVVDKVIEDTHVINGKQVEIKRTIPKGSSQTKDFKTKKIFVGGIPTTVTEEELKKFFNKYGKVVEHEIIHDHATKRSRGFGFVIFDNEKVVDELLSKGNMIELAGSQVEIKKAEPKKASNPPAPHGYGSEAPHRAPRPFDEGIGGGFGGGGLYSGYGDVGFGPSSYRTAAGLGPMMGGYGGGYGGGASDFGSGGYGGGLGAGIGGYRGESSLGYSSRLGLSRYGREEGLGGYGVGSTNGYGAYESGPSAGYGSAGLYGRGGGGYGAGGGAGAGYGGGGGAGAGRYHPYGR